LVERSGAIDFTVRDLAQACGVSIAAVYRHFSSKNELFVEVASIGFSMLQRAFEQASQPPQPGEPPDRMGRIGRAYVQFAIDHEGYFRVMFSRTLTGMHEFARISQVRDATFLALVSSLAEVQGKDPSAVSVKSGESNPKVLRNWAVVHGLSFLWLDRNLNMSREQFESMLLDLFANR
jgi:AcrR family transcriptional regulator